MNPHDERAGGGLRYRSDETLPYYVETERAGRNRAIVYGAGASLYWGVCAMAGAATATLVITGAVAVAAVLVVTIVLALAAYAVLGAVQGA